MFQSRGVEGLARAIALPHEHPPTRFPSFPALERTAVLSYNYPGQWDVPMSDDAVGPVRSLLMRQPTYPLWLDQSVKQSGNYITWALSDPFVLHPDEEDQMLPASYAASGTGNGTGAASWLTVTGGGTDQPLAYHLLGRDEGTGPAPWHYHAGGGQSVVYIRMATGFDPVGTPVLECEFWGGPGNVVTSQSFTGSYLPNDFIFFNVVPPITAAFNSNVWWRPTQYSRLGTAATMNSEASFLVAYAVNGLGGATAGSNLTLSASAIVGTVVRMLPFARPIDYAVSDEPWNDTRLTAVSALFTNVTKVLNKEGTVLAGRLVPTSSKVPALAWNFSKEQLSVISPAEKAYLALEHGHYTYAPPSTDLAQFWDYTFPLSGRSSLYVGFIGGQTLPVVRLDNSSLVNCAIFADMDGGTSLAINVDWHVEFRTTSQLWPLGLSAMTLETLHQAQLALVAAGFFFPNESHKVEMNSIIAKIRSWARIAQPIVSAINPALGQAMEVAERVAEASTKQKAKSMRQEKRQEKAQSAPKKAPKAPPDLQVKKGSTTPPTTSIAKK